MLMAMALAVTFAIADVPAECANPPSRISSDYWDYIDACGCTKLERPSRASSDYGRYMKACSAWRERNPAAGLVSSEPAPSSSPSPSPSPAGAECATPPSCAEWRQANPVVVLPTPRPKPRQETPKPDRH